MVVGVDHLSFCLDTYIAADLSLTPFRSLFFECVCACVCLVKERERGKERERERERLK